MKPRLMYLEDKTVGSEFTARIGRVTFSKTGRTIYYQGRAFHELGDGGESGDYAETATGAAFRISGTKQIAQDADFRSKAVPIDEDAREEYWTKIRKRPDFMHRATT